MAVTLTQKPEATQTAALVKQIRYMILEGRFSAQEPLPSQRELAIRYDVGVQVVRSALDLLQDEGLVYKRERRGVFVRIDPFHVDTQGKGEQDQAADSSLAPLRCINFIERSTGTSPGFVRTGYLSGFSEALENCNIKMRFVTCPSQEAKWQNMFSAKYELQEQGCVLINVLSAPLMRWLDQRQIPFVVQNNKTYAHSEFPPHHCVCINKVRGGFEAARHLVDLGHQRIGYLGEVDQNNVWNSDVFAGCLAGVSHGGLHLHQGDVLSVAGASPAVATQQIHEYLSRPDRPTAVMTFNDTLALIAIDVAKQLGLSVPHDLSVVGYDNVIEAEESDPGLTTYISPRVMLARTVVETLLAVHAGQSNRSQTTVMDGHLIVRGSTAPPKERA